MAIHIDVEDPKHRKAAAEILRRHDNGEPEANITSAVRDFLIVTDLARSEEMVEENPPSGASRRAVDLTALDTFIEFKRRIGTASGGSVSVCLTRFQIYSRLVYSLSPNHNCCNLPASTAQYVIS